MFGVAAAAVALAAGAVAQAPDESLPASRLDLPANPQVFGAAEPNVRKATAIVNGDVITETDVNQRLALMVASAGGRVEAEELQRLRLQVLRNLIDETLQIQAARRQEIKVEDREIATFFGRVAKNFGRAPKDFEAFLRQIGSSPDSMKRQIQGELAWQRLQQRKISPFVNVGDDEVQAILEKLEKSRGSQEYRIGEIFLAATPETSAAVRANAQKVVQQIRGGAPFSAYARQYSEASTAAVGGDLGWVRAEQLPEQLAAVAPRMQVGQVSDPIPVEGGFSILALQDARQVLTADPRDATLSVKQISLSFPKNASQAIAAPRVEALLQATRTMGGCGGADAAAAKLGAEVVSSDQIRVRDLPGPLQTMMLNLQVGQATQPFGSIEDGVRVLVLCGRDEASAGGAPSFDQIYAQLEEERVNRRSRRYLRDLRRDAVIDYR